MDDRSCRACGPNVIESGSPQRIEQVVGAARDREPLDSVPMNHDPALPCDPEVGRAVAPNRIEIAGHPARHRSPGFSVPMDETAGVPCNPDVVRRATVNTTGKTQTCWVRPVIVPRRASPTEN